MLSSSFRREPVLVVGLSVSRYVLQNQVLSEPTCSVYSVSKAALIKFTENLAAETKRQGVAVFAVNPGIVTIGLTELAMNMQDSTESHAGRAAAWIRQVVEEGILPRGALVLTGVTTDPLPIVPLMLLWGQQRIIGTLVGSRRDMQELLQLAVQNNIRPMTETHPLEEANEAHERPRANQVRFRAVLTPE